MWRQKIKYFIACCLLLVATNIAASPIEDLIEILTNIKKMQANFLQMTKLRDHTETIEGKMWLEKPGKFRWQVDAETSGFLIVVDGKKIWHHDFDLEQVSVQKLASKIDFPPMRLLLLEDLKWLEEDFSVSYKGGKEKQCFSLVAKDVADDSQATILCFKDKQLEKLSLVNELGQEVEFRFSKVKLNNQIDAKYFKFTAPTNVDIIGDM